MSHLVCPHCFATNRVPEGRWRDDPQCGRCHKPLLPGHPVALDDDGLERVLARSEAPVLIDFWAAWCGPCQAFAPQFEAAAQDLRAQALLVKVDSDACPKASVRHRVRSIPTLLLMRGPTELGRQVGARAAREVVAWTRATAQSSSA